ncbi:MAG: NUDIX domain-containing protein [Chitinophagaceae bacterium]|nr:NUDIX domain-containing protein [Chitinophagaceae bacterium]
MRFFNVRVYGLLINEQQEILVSDEYIQGAYFTKFPGGGLEFGEGTRDCLAREFMEEMNLNIAVEEHFYTTDFFQLSAFKPDQQIISIYYKVRALERIAVPLREKPFDFDARQLLMYEERKQTETFRFIKLKEYNPEMMTLPIDKVVAALLIQE